MSEAADPIERIVGEALRAAGIRYVHESGGLVPPLDFYLPDSDVWIECKQFHTDRIAEQMSRVESIIVIQGKRAAEAFAEMIRP